MDRFWVGGAGTWNTSSTTNWSATSGGGGGASVPTVADSVFFDQAGTYTVTMTGALACLDITVSAGTVTFATGTSPTLEIRGSMSLLAGTVWSSTGTITFSSTATGKTVTTNGTTLGGAATFNGTGGEWTLGSALSLAGAVGNLSLFAGTLNTSNFAIACHIFSINSSTTRTINLGSSTVTVRNSFNAASQTNLTFNAGTSQITMTGTGQSLLVSTGLTFYNVAFTSTTSGTSAIGGSNTFNNLTVTAPSTAGVTTVTFAAQQTINGTLSTTGTAGNRRVFFASATYGISVDLVVNSALSLTDADFRGLYVRGTAAPISGTRIGNRGECRGITFSTPKTVFWNLAAGGNWSANAWALSAGGGVSTDNFPLPQDTATIVNTGLNTSAPITFSTDLPNISAVDMSGRTNAMTISFASVSPTVYGNWTNGSGTAFTGTNILIFSGGTTQTITSAGKTFTCPITVDTYGGTVQLADALNTGAFDLTVTNGSFNTVGYAVTAARLVSSNSNVRAISLGSSTLTLRSSSPVSFSNSLNLNFNAGTSTINASVLQSGSASVDFGELTYYNVLLNNENSSTFDRIFSGSNTFNNLTLSGTSTQANIQIYSFAANQTINGTLTCAGASAVRRIFLRSSTIGTPRTLTVNAISATDCDFRDITLAGTASGATPTRAGNCGGNTGITFPAAKTVYWNLTGARNWSNTGWATGSGGTPDINNFPLAQDTAVFDDTGAITSMNIDAAWNIGTMNGSARTSALNLSVQSGASPSVYGNWLFGSGMAGSSATNGTLVFSKNGTQTITSNGVQFGGFLTINHPLGNVQLADALSLTSSRNLTLTAGTFDAVTYNVTTGLFVNSSGTTLRMGTGTWTLSGVGTVWNASPTNIFVGTSTIVLSDTSTSARTLNGGGYLNKVTIGGTTGISTLNINAALTIGELASTKTVAHTITFQASLTATVGKWSVTGTLGNVVTVNSSTAGTAFTLSIAGPANSGINYLSVRDCTVATTSPGEFYVGANSTNVSNNTRVIFTATPAPRTLYWVGGTGNWSSTTKWDTTSGGGGGAAIPTSLDAVIFNSASNATAYTATIDAGVTLARCAAFTMAGPASGNVTFAGSVGIAFHGNVSFAATGISRTYTGEMNWAGNSSYTFTTNGQILGSQYVVNGIGSTWTLGSALNAGLGGFTVTYGTFSTSASNYSFTVGQLTSSNSNVRSLVFNGSTVTIIVPVGFATSTNLTFSAGTSTLNIGASNFTFSGGSQTFYNVFFTDASSSNIAITGANTFNTLSFAGRNSVGITPVTFAANQTIGTLTLNAGTASAYRTFLASNTIGTQRTLNVTTLTAGAADIDFRDIAITGAAAPLTGTRFGDAKGNSGITFPAAKTVYWKSSGGATWGNAGTSWSLTNGGTAVATAFPLAQDTAYIPFATPNSGSTIIVNANYNIGTLDMSERNGSALVTLDTSTSTPSIYGNWINGTGTTLSGTGVMTFAGRGAQTITSAGKIFTQALSIDTPSGSVTLQDALTLNQANLAVLAVRQGTFDAATYNVTLSSSLGGFSSGVNTLRTVAIGSGTWTVAGSSSSWSISGSNLTVTGTGTISLTNASSKTFAGGGVNYSGITLNQGGAGTLTITGNNTFKDITNTYSATGATTIALGNTTQTLTGPWTATGAASRVLTVSGTSAATPGILRFTGGGTAANVDYLNISNVRAYDIFDEWYAGANSTNSGSLGWYFQSGIVPTSSIYYGAINVTQIYYGSTPVTAIYYGATQVF